MARVLCKKLWVAALILALVCWSSRALMRVVNKPNDVVYWIWTAQYKKNRCKCFDSGYTFVYLLVTLKL